MPFLFRLTCSELDTCVQFPKLDLAPIVAAVPEFKGMSLQQAFSKMYSLLYKFIRSMHSLQSFTLQTVARTMAHYFVDELNITVHKMPFFDFKFFEEFSSEDTFSTRQILEILQTTGNSQNYYEEKEWKSILFFGAMLEVLKGEYPGHKMMMFDVGYLCSHVFGAFLALIKSIQMNDGLELVEVKIPSVERFFLSSLPSTLQLSVATSPNAPSPSAPSSDSSTSSPPVYTNTPLRQNKAALAVFREHFEKHGCCSKEDAEAFGKRFNMEPKKVRTYFYARKSVVKKRKLALEAKESIDE